ncbi:MAG: FecR domain-containing protein [Opitutales bacterium]
MSGQDVRGGAGRGVVIIALKAGPTRFLDIKGKVMPEEKTKIGSALPEGYVAQAGVGGKIVLLLSNGTITTLESQTKLKVREFTQEPFDAGGRKVSDLKEEPSKSNVKLDLDWGSIVVTTKKLDRDSSLHIHSPSGIAGIRGTEFRMSLKPGAGIKLDVSESTSFVSFTPTGAVQPLVVRPGQGLDVSAAGVATPRPINPAIEQNITIANTAAVEAAGGVSLTTVSEAMTEATEAIKVETIFQDEEVDEDAAIESNSGADITPPDKEGSVADGRTSALESLVSEPENFSAASGSQVDPSELLENNPDVKQARKTGRVNELTRELIHLGLTDEQVLAFHGYSSGVQRALLTASKETAGRLLGLTGAQESNLATFFSYSDSLRERILGLRDDVVLLSLLSKAYKESWLQTILTDENLIASDPSREPAGIPIVEVDAPALHLSAKLKESGNSFILDGLLELNNGELTPELARVGEVANLLLTDITVSEQIEASGLLDGKEVLGNPFYEEVASVYRNLETDSLTVGEVSFLGGRNLDLLAGSYGIVGDATSVADVLVLSALEKLSLSGEISLAAMSSGKSPRMVLMSGGSLEAGKGLTLEAVTNDLVLSVRRDIALEDATLRGSLSVVVQSLRDLTMRNTELSASNLATLKAAKDVYVDGLRFNQDLPKIVMEATTIRLMNVDFPANAAVNLNSLKGPIDGRYPNFGTSVPAAQQFGRVNFLQNVKAGGNLMRDRATFDQFGGKVRIGKLPTP